MQRASQSEHRQPAGIIDADRSSACPGRLVSQYSDSLLVVFPGVAITLVVLGFNFFGDAVRDAFDPKLRGR